MQSEIISFLKSKTAKQFYKIFAFLILWVVFLVILRCLELINIAEINQNIFLVINAAVFLFSLLASPATFEINAFRIKIGVNKPAHIHFTKPGFEIRDFQNEWSKEEIKEIIREQNLKN